MCAEELWVVRLANVIAVNTDGWGLSMKYKRKKIRTKREKSGWIRSTTYGTEEIDSFMQWFPWLFANVNVVFHQLNFLITWQSGGIHPPAIFNNYTENYS